MELTELVPAVLAGVASGVATYTAIRVEIAILKVRAEHNEKRAEAAHELAADAHDRLNRLRSLRERDTNL